MIAVYVWVLLSIHVQRNGTLVRDYQSTFSRQDTCTRIAEEMNRASADYRWTCEKHIVE